MKELLDYGHVESEHSEFTTGYGTDSQGRKFCYACCAEQDKQAMSESGKYVLYLVQRGDEWHVTNWPSSLDYKAYGIRHSWHNMSGKDGRTDFWFKDYQGREWHGYQIGQWNQIAYVKRIKAQGV